MVSSHLRRVSSSCLSSMFHSDSLTSSFFFFHFISHFISISTNYGLGTSGACSLCSTSVSYVDLTKGKNCRCLPGGVCLNKDGNANILLGSLPGYALYSTGLIQCNIGDFFYTYSKGNLNGLSTCLDCPDQNGATCNAITGYSLTW